jgi:hypothetical protein
MISTGCKNDGDTNDDREGGRTTTAGPTSRTHLPRMGPTTDTGKTQ